MSSGPWSARPARAPAAARPPIRRPAGPVPRARRSGLPVRADRTALAPNPVKAGPPTASVAPQPSLVPAVPRLADVGAGKGLGRRRPDGGRAEGVRNGTEPRAFGSTFASAWWISRRPSARRRREALGSISRPILGREPTPAQQRTARQGRTPNVRSSFVVGQLSSPEVVVPGVPSTRDRRVPRLGLELLDMRDQLIQRGPSLQIQAEHLEGP